MSSEKALFACLFSFPFPHFHDHWYALRGCRNTWWLTGGAPYWGGGVGVRLSTPPFFSEASFLLLLSTSASPQTGQQPETGLRLSVATSSWPECVLESAGRLNPSAPPRPPADCLDYLRQKAPQRFFEKVVPVKDGEKDVAA